MPITEETKKKWKAQVDYLNRQSKYLSAYDSKFVTGLLKYMEKSPSKVLDWNQSKRLRNIYNKVQQMVG